MNMNEQKNAKKERKTNSFPFRSLLNISKERTALQVAATQKDRIVGRYRHFVLNDKFIETKIIK